jgi:octaprenyl-diphosphate synthase
VEFIHTATLLHDDVVDESQRRRGRPTANLLWDNKSSVLVGDYLFARAFQLMVETQNLRVLDILSNAAATIAEGEVLQLTAAMNLATTEDIYLQVIRGKTAALFEAACEVGGVIAGQPEPVSKRPRAVWRRAGHRVPDGRRPAGLGRDVGPDRQEHGRRFPRAETDAAGDPRRGAADAAERAFWVRTIEKGEQGDGDLDHAMEILRRHGTLDRPATRRIATRRIARAALADVPSHA